MALDGFGEVITDPREVRYPVITICASSRFGANIDAFYRELSWAGALVFSLCGYMHGDDTRIATEPGLKEMLDNMHRAKIRRSDSVAVLNIGDYIGESTQKEINYAEALGVPVYRYIALGRETMNFQEFAKYVVKATCIKASIKLPEV